ncbi:MAG: hypothetical protein Q7K16_04355 [Candidatus Azambacteria bacterium]|nr:hypothetical protein [Candidatus Azambacteria bacterium]
MFDKEHIYLEKPPKRLFQAIIERLKIEKSLRVFKGKFTIFSGLFVISIVFIVLAILIFKYDLRDSESFSLISLLFSDTLAVITYYKYFILAFLESMPAVSITISLAAVFLTMIFLRFIVGYYDKISTLNKLVIPPSRKATEGK